jgi:hypothetical protein
MRARPSTPHLISLRAICAEQVEYERGRKTERALKAADMLDVLDELLRLRREDSARDLIGEQLGPARALSRVVNACHADVDLNAEGCVELLELRKFGWRLECLVQDSGLIINGDLEDMQHLQLTIQKPEGEER